jgi:hypothetical protein
LITHDGWGWADTEIHGFTDGVSPTGVTNGTTGGGFPTTINGTNDAELYAFHTGGSFGAHADGSVHFYNQTMDNAVLIALITMNTLDTVTSTDY